MPVEVEVFTSPGCGKCGRAKDVLREMALELGPDRVRWREVNVLDELDHAVSLGVLAAPAIAIDGELVFTTLPSARKLRAELESRLQGRDP
ncbi:MAG TPA: glutaredoxin [Chromatiales bacterium]|nr:glutaredoxin [Chromatiales bacterium]